jgi:uncharacterized protein (DUF934 family)
MRRILRRRELIDDEWRYLGEAGDTTDASPLIIPLAELRGNPNRWRARTDPLGVRIGPAERVEDLSEHLAQLRLIAVEFPSATDGRGYSHGRILRTRLQFRGELRAIGLVKQDQIFLMARCGFDAFELAAGEDEQEALRALQRYTVAYQPADPGVVIERQRYFVG